VSIEVRIDAFTIHDFFAHFRLRSWLSVVSTLDRPNSKLVIPQANTYIPVTMAVGWPVLTLAATSSAVDREPKPDRAHRPQASAPDPHHTPLLSTPANISGSGKIGEERS
jgi:hypothetical protein